MKEKNTNTKQYLYYDEDQIDFRELFFILLKAKWIILSVTAFISILGVIYSLSLPNIYESRALLARVDSSESIASSMTGSAIANLAGVNIPSSDENSNSSKAIKKISSLSFFQNNILPNINLPDLMAVKVWNPKTNELVFKKNIYDSKNSTWIREFSYPQRQIPSAQESFNVFRKKHLIISEDEKSGFITVSIKHQSPFVAKQWVELIINEVNNFYREKERLEAERSSSYLNQQISMNNLSEINEVLASLLQEEIKKLTLIEASKFYVFDYIDPPAIMEEKSEPKRALICILISLFGFIFSIPLVFIRYYISNKKVN